MLVMKLKGVTDVQIHLVTEHGLPFLELLSQIKRSVLSSDCLASWSPGPGGAGK